MKYGTVLPILFVVALVLAFGGGIAAAFFTGNAWWLLLTAVAFVFMGS